MPEPGQSPARPCEVTVFGDSHSQFFFPSGFYVGRCGFRSSLPFRVVGEAIPAASLAGFRPGASTLKVKEIVAQGLDGSSRMVLAFGQVDLELGYYYRLVIKNESMTPEAYVNWLLDIYADFLRGISRSDCEIALKGVNLTALTPIPFAVRYVSRIVTEGRDVPVKEAEQMVTPFILPEAAQNDMHLQFNRGLAKLARNLGMRYFDINDRISDGSVYGASISVPRLSDNVKTARFDHHLADTVAVRRWHYEALGRAFDLL